MLREEAYPHRPSQGRSGRLDRATRLRVAAAVQRLVLTNAGNLEKLKGVDPPEYRLRAEDWRVRFSYSDTDTVSINRV